jgi:hypothetical protein
VNNEIRKQIFKYFANKIYIIRLKTSNMEVKVSLSGDLSVSIGNCTVQENGEKDRSAHEDIGQCKKGSEENERAFCDGHPARGRTNRKSREAEDCQKGRHNHCEETIGQNDMK